MKLRKQTEDVAALRRKLPPGGKLKEDYVFEEMDKKTEKIKQTKLSDLFEKGKDSLIIYSYMFAPEQEKPCTSCTSIIDGINGMVFNVNDRTNFVMIAKAPIKKLMKWAKSKGWNSVRILSSYGNTYNTDYFAEMDNGGQMPMLNVFRNKGKSITHFYGTELLYAQAEKGQDGRHVDTIWPLWNLFDLLPEGRGKDWYPKHSS
jgi:predicted dithiol-disulfide oxidoreductase (DUF899 family)